MKILLFKPGAIGDVILTTPLLRQLRRRFPQAKIDYLVGQKPAPVLRNNPYLSQVIPFDEAIIYQKHWLGFLKLIGLIRKNKYQAIFVLGKHKLYNLIAWLWRIPTRIGFDRCGEGIFLTYRVPFYGARHDIFYYLDLVRGLGLSPDYKDWQSEIFLTEPEKEFAENFWQENKLFNKKVIAICPGGGVNIRGREDIRRWPLENYIELIEKLKEENFEVILLGSQEEKDLEEKIFNEVKCFSLIGQTSLLEAGAIFEKCWAVVCTDGGLMHLAASVNRKIISIFGPTNPLEKAPLARESQWIRRPEIGCAPCYDLRANFPECKTKECLNLIKSNEVFKILSA